MNAIVSQLEPPSSRIGMPPRDGMKARRVAIVDRFASGRDPVVHAIRSMGHDATEFTGAGEFADAMLAGARFDLLLAALEGGPSTQIFSARFLRHFAGGRMPLLLLAHASQLLDDCGELLRVVNDFVLMPCRDCELKARVREMSRIGESEVDRLTRLVFGPYAFDPLERTLDFEGRIVRLQPREFGLALHMFRHAGQAQSRESIFRAVWGESLLPTRALDVGITRLRKRLHLMSPSGATVLSVRSFGYCLRLRGEVTPVVAAPSRKETPMKPTTAFAGSPIERTHSHYRG